MQGKARQIMPSANISEIFSSLQGEGPYAGIPMTFVRFAGCELGCRWCDTQHAAHHNPTCRVKDPIRANLFEEYPNPISTLKLNECVLKYGDNFLSVTGGEPLEGVNFLAAWLPTIHEFRKILLETNGILYEELGRITDHIDIISMDIKLPSSTGLKPFWREHGIFLSTALQKPKDIYVKIVVTTDTSDKDLQDAIKLVVQTNKFIPVVIQPVSPTKESNATITQDRLQSVFRLCKAWLPNTKVGPQMHKIWNIP